MTKLQAVVAVAFAAAFSAPGLNADETLSVRLAPAPRDASMRAEIGGSGSARVTLVGNRLTVAGSFMGFTSPATRAELRQGLAVAVRGPAIHALEVTRAKSGTVSGSVALSDAALAAFNAGALYLEIASESAPQGNVLGWLLPASAPVVRDR